MFLTLKAVPRTVCSTGLQPVDLAIEVRYFSNLCRTPAYMQEVDNCSRGIVKDRNRLYWEDFKQISSPYPPPDEQVRIADAIEANTYAVNHAMDRTKQEIDLIHEYRTRLIADVVTGKLDVRETAARLPLEVEETETEQEVEQEAYEEEEIENADLIAAAEQAGDAE
jgi:type I restriction enzyme S subunit